MPARVAHGDGVYRHGTVTHVLKSLLEPGVCATDKFLYPNKSFAEVHS